MAGAQLVGMKTLECGADPTGMREIQPVESRQESGGGFALDLLARRFLPEP